MCPLHQQPDINKACENVLTAIREQGFHLCEAVIEHTKKSNTGIENLEKVLGRQTQSKTGFLNKVKGFFKFNQNEALEKTTELGEVSADAHKQLMEQLIRLKQVQLRLSEEFNNISKKYQSTQVPQGCISANQLQGELKGIGQELLKTKSQLEKENIKTALGAYASKEVGKASTGSSDALNSIQQPTESSALQEEPPAFIQQDDEQTNPSGSGFKAESAVDAQVRDKIDREIAEGKAAEKKLKEFEGSLSSDDKQRLEEAVRIGREREKFDADMEASDKNKKAFSNFQNSIEVEKENLQNGISEIDDRIQKAQSNLEILPTLTNEQCLQYTKNDCATFNGLLQKELESLKGEKQKLEARYAEVQTIESHVKSQERAYEDYRDQLIASKETNEVASQRAKELLSEKSKFEAIVASGVKDQNFRTRQEDLSRALADAEHLPKDERGGLVLAKVGEYKLADLQQQRQQFKNLENETVLAELNGYKDKYNKIVDKYSAPVFGQDALEERRKLFAVEMQEFQKNCSGSSICKATFIYDDRFSIATKPADTKMLAATEGASGGREAYRLDITRASEFQTTDVTNIKDQVDGIYAKQESAIRSVLQAETVTSQVTPSEMSGEFGTITPEAPQTLRDRVKNFLKTNLDSAPLLASDPSMEPMVKDVLKEIETEKIEHEKNSARLAQAEMVLGGASLVAGGVAGQAVKLGWNATARLANLGSRFTSVGSGLAGAGQLTQGHLEYFFNSKDTNLSSYITSNGPEAARAILDEYREADSALFNSASSVVAAPLSIYAPSLLNLKTVSTEVSVGKSLAHIDDLPASIMPGATAHTPEIPNSLNAVSIKATEFNPGFMAKTQQQVDAEVNARQVFSKQDPGELPVASGMRVYPKSHSLSDLNNLPEGTHLYTQLADGRTLIAPRFPEGGSGFNSHRSMYRELGIARPDDILTAGEIQVTSANGVKNFLVNDKTGTSADLFMARGQDTVALAESHFHASGFHPDTLQRIDPKAVQRAHIEAGDAAQIIHDVRNNPTYFQHEAYSQLYKDLAQKFPSHQHPGHPNDVDVLKHYEKYNRRPEGDALREAIKRAREQNSPELFTSSLFSGSREHVFVAELPPLYTPKAAFDINIGDLIHKPPLSPDVTIRQPAVAPEIKVETANATRAPPVEARTVTPAQTRYIEEYGDRSVSVAENQKFIRYAVASDAGNADGAVAYSYVENAFKKNLNDSFGQKNLVDAPDNALKARLETKLKADPIVGPQVAAIYEDYKGMGVAFKGMNPEIEARYSRLIKETLAEHKVSLEGSGFMQGLNLEKAMKSNPSAGNPEMWYRSGMGRTADEAALAARAARNDSSIASVKNFAGIRTNLDNTRHAFYGAHHNLTQNFNHVDGLFEASANVNGAHVISLEAAGLIRKAYAEGSTALERTSKIKAALSERYGSAVGEEADFFRRYYEHADAFSPPLRIAQRVQIDWTHTRPGGAVSVDFRDMGAANFQATAEALLASRGQDLDKTISFARQGEGRVTTQVDGKKEIIDKSVQEAFGLSGSNGRRLRVDFTGDDGAIFMPQAMNADSMSALLQTIYRNGGNPSDLRITNISPTYFNSTKTVNSSEIGAYVGQAEGMAKALEKEIRSTSFSIIYSPVEGQKNLGSIQVLVTTSKTGEDLAAIEKKIKSVLENNKDYKSITVKEVRRVDPPASISPRNQNTLLHINFQNLYSRSARAEVQCAA